jgi:hypothetical protein
MSRKDPPPLRIVRTRRSVKLVQGRDVVSHLLRQPGPTHGFFDVLAACAAAFAPDSTGGGLALLGFAAGGVVAPLRALGFRGPIDAADLSLAAEPLFREVASGWSGVVRLARADAAAWLRGRRSVYDVIVEDLTVPGGPQGAYKPPVCLDELPPLVRSRLAPAGVAVTNVLPLPHLSWTAILDRLAAPHERALVVDIDAYENRILIAGESLPPARQTAARLRAALRGIRSRQADRIRVCTWR